MKNKSLAFLLSCVAATALIGGIVSKVTAENINTFTPSSTNYVNFLSAPAKRLKASIGPADMSFQLSDVKGWDGNALTSSSFGGDAYVVFHNDAGTAYEIMQIDPTTIGSSAITILKRGMQFNGDLSISSSSLELTWVKNTTIVELGTDVPQLLAHTVQIAGDQNISGNKTFDGNYPIAYSTAPVINSALQIPSKAYVDSVATSGAPDASQSAKGLVQIATPSQIASGTATSTDGAQTLWNVVSAGQYGKTYGATPTVVSNVYGSATGTASTTYTFNTIGTGNFTLPTFRTLIGGHAVSSSVSMVVTVNGSNAGGIGGQVAGTILTPALGTTYYTGVDIGGGSAGAPGSGTGGVAGQNGGGMSWFSANSTYSNGTVLAVAAGAGGSGGNGWGGGAQPGANGGGTNGNNPSGGNTQCSPILVVPTQSAGGTNSYAGGTLTNGSAGLGGNGGQGVSESPQSGGGGGGGGAGYYGGAGGVGGCNNGGGYGGGGGQGGSSYITSPFTSTSNTSGGSIGGTGSVTVVFTYSYNDPTESVSSTVSGNNFGGTVTVSAATTHLSPTTSTINFAPWNFPVSGVSCTANTWASSLAPFILAENTTSVEFGFSSTIAGGKYNYLCNAY
jgi:hypothetical protein